MEGGLGIGDKSFALASGTTSTGAARAVGCTALLGTLLTLVGVGAAGYAVWAESARRAPSSPRRPSSVCPGSRP